MTFTPKTWHDKPTLTTPIEAADLTRYETALDAHDAAIEALQTAEGTPGPQGPTGPTGPTGATGPAGSTSIGGISGLQAALDAKPNFVVVSTGSEARPAGALCIWIGGTTQPTNMGNDDLWWAAGVPADTTPPSVPTGLASSSITGTAFTVSWTASTGSPTQYEMFIGGVSAGTTSSTSMTITGKSPSTAYSVTVRARDAAANWSSQSTALVVTTAAGGSPTHTIFGVGGPPVGTVDQTHFGTPAIYNDATAGIVTANQFYGAVGVETWVIKGARVWVASGLAATVAAKKMAFRLSKIGSNVPPQWNSSASTEVVSSTLVAGWNEVTFPSPIPFSAASATDRLWVMGQFRLSDGVTTTPDYFHWGESAASGLTATLAADGSTFYLARTGATGDGESIGWNDALPGFVGVYYGYDIILQES